MAAQPARLQLEGHRELARQLSQIGGKELRKEYGQVHKRIGMMVITAAGGKKTGVGEGAGSTMRPSASTREIQIRVGGRHRGASRRQQWGKRQVWPGGRPPERPNIIATAEGMQDQIMDEYEEGVADVVRKAGLRLR